MKHSAWLENLFHPLLIGGMFGCIAIALADLVHIFVPTWNGAYLVAACILAAVEANYSYRLMRARFHSDPIRFRLAELAILFIIIKALSYLGRSWESVAAEIQTWPDNPLAIITLETVVSFVLALFAWWVSTQTTYDLGRIGEAPEIQRGQAPPRESIAGRILSGGGFLLSITGLTYSLVQMIRTLIEEGTAQAENLTLPATPGMVTNVLAYFLLALVLMAQVQFATLRKRWQAQKVGVTGKLANRWVRYSLILIGLATLIAFLLPTSYTVGLLDILRGILGLLVDILASIAQLILLIFAILLNLLNTLFGGEVQSAPAPPAAPPQLSPTLPENGASLDWPQWVQSIAFWTIALGVILYLVRSYLRDHPEILRALTSLSFFRMLRQMWAAIWRAIWRWLSGIADVVRERLPRRFSLRRHQRAFSPAELFRFFRLSALSPRERTLYYYLSILRRAGEQGLPRRRSQTPREYDDTIEPHLPRAQQDMAALTDAFVEARYSTHPVNREQESQTRARWQEVKTALQALKRQRRKKQHQT